MQGMKHRPLHLKQSTTPAPQSQAPMARCQISTWRGCWVADCSVLVRPAHAAYHGAGETLAWPIKCLVCGYNAYIGKQYEGLNVTSFLVYHQVTTSTATAGGVATVAMTVPAEGLPATTDSPASQQTLSTVDLNALANSVEAQADGKYVHFTKGQVIFPLSHPTCHMSSHAVTRAASRGFCCKR